LTPAADSGAAAQKEVPKAEKPKVEVYVFAYCPYGLQMEKAFMPIYDALKGKADFNIVAIGAMHGEFERVESLRQICVEKLYGKDKLWAYLKAFDESSTISSCSGDAKCLEPMLQTIYTKLAIDKTKVNSCMEKDAPAIYDEQGKQAASLGISGSPSLVINGVQTQASRSPDGVAQAVCSAFTTSPSACSNTFSTAQASAGFGGSSETAGTAASGSANAGCAAA
jgi:hypothetical protein